MPAGDAAPGPRHCRPDEVSEGSLTHPQRENLRLVHVNRAGPGAPGHVTDTGETGWSHSLGLVALTHVLEACERQLGLRRAGIGLLPPHPKAQETIIWVGRVRQDLCYSACPPSATPAPWAAF